MIVVCIKQGRDGCWPNLGQKYTIEKLNTNSGKAYYRFPEFNITSPNLDNFKEVSEIRNEILDQLL